MPRVFHLRSGLLGLGLCLSAVVLSAAEPFPEVHNTEPSKEPFLSPQEAVKRLRMPPGFQANVFAAEPDVRQPIAMTFDAAGRMWIAENYTYAEQPLRFEKQLQDRIIVLEDADGDGRADKRTVFYDQFKGLSSVEVGFGGVYALAPPNLFFIPDADLDLKPDADPIVVLDGFEIGPSNTHNFANGLKWGPDGWLYGRVGITAPGKIGRPGTPDDQRVPVGPSIWRYHPVTHAVEEVCTGTTNPWGHDWNEHGELFFINTVIGHLWHVQSNAHYRRMFGADRNPYVYQLLEQTADHFHWDTAEAWNEAKKGVSDSTSAAGGGHAHCGMMIYLGDNWPAEYRGKVFTLNMHGYRVNVDSLEQTGATYVGHHDKDMIFSDDPYFRGTEITYGPDGSVYIADWSDVGECHENDGVHRTSGRIYKITYGDLKPQPSRDLQALSSLQLLEFLKSANEWPVRQARRLLQERAANGEDMAAVVTALQTVYDSETNIPQKLRYFFALHAVGATSTDWLKVQLLHTDEHIRVAALRFLAEQPDINQQVNDLARMAARDSSGLVLSTLASILPKFAVQPRFRIATALGQRAELSRDPVFPLMVWYGVEPVVPQNPKAAITFATGIHLPLVRQFTARRLAQDWDKLKPAEAEALVAALKSADNAQRRDLLTGMNSGLRGWRKVNPPAVWTDVQALLAKSTNADVQQLTRELGVVFGDGRAMDQLKEIAMSGEADIATRRSAIASLIEAQPDDLGKVLRSILNDRDLSPEAIRGLATVGDKETSQLLVSRFNGFYPAGKEAAVQTLAARPADAMALVSAIAAGKIERTYVPVYLVRQMQNYDHAELRDLVQKTWPELRPITADKKQRIEGFKQKLTAEALSHANLSAGRGLWEKSCGKCHQLFGEGGKIGPDLTGAQRHNLDYLLENVVDPSATLLPQFRMTTIVMNDGRAINGVVISKTEQTWQVQTATDLLTVRVAEIEEHAATTQSLMPEGLLDLLTPEEVQNLLGYVMSPRQVPKPDDPMASSSR